MCYWVQRYCKSSEMQNKLVKIGYFGKKIPKKFWCLRKKYYLCTRNRGRCPLANDIGVWCNGNTTDSGPVILGSSPSTPTLKSQDLVYKGFGIFFFYNFRCVHDCIKISFGRPLQYKRPGALRYKGGRPNLCGRAATTSFPVPFSLFAGSSLPVCRLPFPCLHVPSILNNLFAIILIVLNFVNYWLQSS